MITFLPNFVFLGGVIQYTNAKRDILVLCLHREFTVKTVTFHKASSPNTLCMGLLHQNVRCWWASTVIFSAELSLMHNSAIHSK